MASPPRLSTSPCGFATRHKITPFSFLSHGSPALALPRATWLSKAAAAAGRTTCRNHVTSAPGPEGRQASHDASPLMLMLEGVSQAEIGLDKVVSRQIGEVITNFAENPDMGSKAIFKSAPNMAEHPIRSKVVT